MDERTKRIMDQRPAGYLLASVFGVITGIILCISGIMGLKWLIAAVLGVTGFFALFAFTKEYRYSFLLLAILALPFRLDFHLIFKETPFAQLKGLPVTLFDVIVTILFVYWIIQLMLRKEKFCIFPSISFPALAYILLAAISAFRSEDGVLSFCMLFLIVKGYLIFIYFANNIKTRNQIGLIVTALAVGVFIQSCLGILQHFTGGTLGLEIFGEGERAFRTARIGYKAISRVGGTIGDPNSLAMFLNFLLPPILSMSFTRIPLRYRMIFALVFVLGGITEIFTLSRGGWISLSFGSIIVLYGVFKGKLKSRVKSFAMMTVSIGLIAFILVGAFQDVRDRLFKDDYGSAYSRIPMIKVALNMIEENPVTGVGLNNYATVMNKYDRTRQSISYNFQYPVHNAFLLIAGESGLLALISFLLILYGAAHKGFRFFLLEDRFLCILGIGFTSSILTWIVHAQFKMDFAGADIPLWLSLGMVAALHRMITAKENIPSRSPVSQQ